MERIYEHEVLPNPRLRKQAGERPLRAHAKRLTDGELLAKLRSFGIEIDRTWLERECARALSAQEIAGPLMDKSTSRSQEAIGSGSVWRPCGGVGFRSSLPLRCLMTECRTVTSC
jgi:hypothetical protein